MITISPGQFYRQRYPNGRLYPQDHRRAVSAPIPNGNPARSADRTVAIELEIEVVDDQTGVTLAIVPRDVRYRTFKAGPALEQSRLLVVIAPGRRAGIPASALPASPGR